MAFGTADAERVGVEGVRSGGAAAGEDFGGGDYGGAQARSSRDRARGIERQPEAHGGTRASSGRAASAGGRARGSDPDGCRRVGGQVGSEGGSRCAACDSCCLCCRAVALHARPSVIAGADVTPARQHTFTSAVSVPLLLAWVARRALWRALRGVDCGAGEMERALSLKADTREVELWLQTKVRRRPCTHRAARNRRSICPLTHTQPPALCPFAQCGRALIPIPLGCALRRGWMKSALLWISGRLTRGARWRAKPVHMKWLTPCNRWSQSLRRRRSV